MIWSKLKIWKTSSKYWRWLNASKFLVVPLSKRRLFLVCQNWLWKSSLREFWRLSQIHVFLGWRLRRKEVWSGEHGGSYSKRGPFSSLILHVWVTCQDVKGWRYEAVTLLDWYKYRNYNFEYLCVFKRKEKCMHLRSIFKYFVIFIYCKLNFLQLMFNSSFTVFLYFPLLALLQVLSLHLLPL